MLFTPSYSSNPTELSRMESSLINFNNLGVKNLSFIKNTNATSPVFVATFESHAQAKNFQESYAGGFGFMLQNTREQGTIVKDSTQKFGFGIKNAQAMIMFGTIDWKQISAEYEKFLEKDSSPSTRPSK